MELFNYSLKNKETEYLTKAVLDNSINIDVILRLLQQDPNWIEDNISGSITYSSFLQILEKSYSDKKFQIYLMSLIEIIDGKNIDNRFFEKMICYPDKNIKEKLLISLSHKKLKENQLRVLCNEGITFECFFELAILYYTDSKYTLETFKEFIEFFGESKYSYMSKELISELFTYYVASDDGKYNFLKSS